MKYRAWILAVSDDGEISTSIHRTEGAAWAQLLNDHGREISDDVNVEEIQQRIEAMYDVDEEEISESLGDVGIDFHIEEVVIDTDTLRKVTPAT